MGLSFHNLDSDIHFWLEGFDFSLLVVSDNLSFRLAPHMDDPTCALLILPAVAPIHAKR